MNNAIQAGEVKSLLCNHSPDQIRHVPIRLKRIEIKSKTQIWIFKWRVGKKCYVIFAIFLLHRYCILMRKRRLSAEGDAFNVRLERLRFRVSRSSPCGTFNQKICKIQNEPTVFLILSHIAADFSEHWHWQRKSTDYKYSSFFTHATAYTISQNFYYRFELILEFETILRETYYWLKQASLSLLQQAKSTWQN